MRKLKLYIAASLNGKIADPDGGVDWLQAIPNPDQSDYGYTEFYASIDTTILGYNTYKQIIDWGIEFPYAGKTNYVFTRKQGLKPTEHVEFISVDHVAFARQLKKSEGQDIWLIGGGQLNTLFLEERLIDELWLYQMPLILSSGIELFEAFPPQTAISFLESRSFSSGVVELKYALRY